MHRYQAPPYPTTTNEHCHHHHTWDGDLSRWSDRQRHERIEIRLDASEIDADILPKYRDMMQRLARDPVGQTLVFEKIMQLFFIHVLGVRPECLQNRRRTKVTPPREWCTDGVAASSTAPGILGPILAFRGEIEAQGRGSLTLIFWCGWWLSHPKSSRAFCSGTLFCLNKDWPSG